MSQDRDPVEYERVQQNEPARFPWIFVLKALLAIIAIPVTIGLVWLIVLICYWLKYGKWLGWDTPIGV